MVKNRCLRTGDKSHEKYGEPEKAPATTTFLNMWHDPLNPTYTSVQVPKVKMLPKHGYALIEEELHKSELDDEILTKENEILQSHSREDFNSNLIDANSNLVMRHNKSSSSVPSTSRCPGLSFKSE